MTTPDNPPTAAPDSSLARELIGGVIAALIALACLLPPLLHLVTGPLGPVIGGFVVANHLKPEARGRAVIAGTLGVSLAALIAVVAFGIAEFSGPKGPPDWFPTSGQLGAVIAGVALYAAVLGAVGAALGARRAAEKAA